MKATELNARYHVQEVIGGWHQNSNFSGTYEECQRYMEEWCHNGNFDIVAEEDYKVDYL